MANEKKPATADLGREILRAALGGAVNAVRPMLSGAAFGAIRPIAEHVAKAMCLTEGIEWSKLSDGEREVWTRRGSVAFLSSTEYLKNLFSSNT